MASMTVENWEIPASLQACSTADSYCRTSLLTPVSEPLFTGKRRRCISSHPRSKTTAVTVNIRNFRRLISCARELFFRLDLDETDAFLPVFFLEELLSDEAFVMELVFFRGGLAESAAVFFFCSVIFFPFTLVLIPVVFRTFTAGRITAAGKISHNIFRVTAAASFGISYGVFYPGSIGWATVIIIFCIFHNDAFLYHCYDVHYI